MQDGMIELDSDNGRVLGFTSDRFSVGSYLWKSGDEITISFIESLARGNFLALVNAIKSAGYAVVVPTPLGRMAEIVEANGYHREVRKCPVTGFGWVAWMDDRQMNERKEGE